MTAQVVIYLGPARSGKTHALVHRYGEVLERARQDAAVDRTLWLAPTARNASAVRKQLLDTGLAACLTPGILTFEQLTTLILTNEAAPSAAITTLSPAAERELMRRVVGWARSNDKLAHFREAAARTGLVDLLVEHIRELKRHGIAADAFARERGRRDRPADERELALLVAEYQRLVTAHDLRDGEDRHAAARDALAAGRCTRLQNLELVVVDGFTDLTRTQHQLLQHLAARAKEVLISLPCDDASGLTSHQSDSPSHQRTQSHSPRPELFAKVATTYAELQHFHPHLKCHHIAPRPLAWPALDYLARYLFGSPRQLPPLPASAAESLGQLEIVEAAGAQDEIVQIARRVKARLTQSPLPGKAPPDEGSNACRPADIVVVFRSLAEAAPRVREVFTQFGIPFSIEAGLPLAATPILKTLVQLLRLDRDDWRFRQLVAVLTNNSLTAIDAGARTAAEWLVRDLQIAQGRDALLARVEQLAASETPDSELSDHNAARVCRARAALPAFRRLAAAFDALPQSATPTEFTAALARLGEQLGLPLFVDNAAHERAGPLSDSSYPDEPGIPTEDLAWRQLLAHFAAIQRLDAALGPPRKLDRSQLFDLLADLVRHERLPWLQDDVGRVRVLAAQTARGISARHLFLAGMSEQSFPSAERAGRLATTDDYRRAAGARSAPPSLGAPSAPSVALPTRSQEEMLLFYEVLTRAGTSLTISYPALDDKAQPLPPSPYVTEIVRTLDPESKGLVRRTAPHLSPIPLADLPPFDVAEWRTQAIARALGPDRDVSLLAGLFRATANSAQRQKVAALAAALEAGLRIIHERQRRDAFGHAEGLLMSPAVAARLADRFGTQHLWSPSQWEDYAACPYRFFLADVLKFAPLGELVLETDYRRRGSLLHQVLATFHRNFGAAPGDAWVELQRDADRFVNELKRTLQGAVDASPRDGIEAALNELDRRHIDKWTDRYGEHHGKYDGAWSSFGEPPRPAHFEFRFGPRRRGDAGPEDAHSTDSTLALDIGGETIYVTGRIDRIDVGRIGDRQVFNVIDYKSGRRPTLTAEKLVSGERLQPAIYVMAAEVLIFGPGNAAPLWAGYWSMQNGVTTDAKWSLKLSVDGATTGKNWDELRPKIVARIGQFVAAIRRGEFPVASLDDDCTSRCDFKTVCRVAQIRSLNKIWPTPDC